MGRFGQAIAILVVLAATARVIWESSATPDEKCAAAGIKAVGWKTAYEFSCKAKAATKGLPKDGRGPAVVLDGSLPTQHGPANRTQSHAHAS
jgi:hypothetical protein